MHLLALLGLFTDRNDKISLPFQIPGTRKSKPFLTEPLRIDLYRECRVVCLFINYRQNCGKSLFCCNISGRGKKRTQSPFCRAPLAYRAPAFCPSFPPHVTKKSEDSKHVSKTVFYCITLNIPLKLFSLLFSAHLLCY